MLLGHSIDGGLMMSVLCAAVSVIVPVDVLRAKYAGGPDAYARETPDGTYCSDGVLTRVGFDEHEQLDKHLQHLAAHRFIATVGGGYAELAVVDEHDGPRLPCPWLAWERRDGVTRAWLVGHPEGDLAVPQ